MSNFNTVRPITACHTPVADLDATDETLMLQYRAGDAEAFTVLYERQKDPPPLFPTTERRRCDSRGIVSRCVAQSVRARTQYPCGQIFTIQMAGAQSLG